MNDRDEMTGIYYKCVVTPERGIRMRINNRINTAIQKKKIKLIATLLTTGMLTGLLTGCGSGSDSSTASAAGLKKTSATVVSSDSDGSGKKSSKKKSSDDSGEEKDTQDKKDVEYFTERDLDPSYDASKAETIKLSGTSIEVSGSGAEVGKAADGSPTATIKQAGVYIVSGTLSDGQLLVDAGDDEKVQIVLSGADMTNNDSACIYVKNADKVFVTLADGTENKLADTGVEYTNEDSESSVDGVIFAKDDICFNGNGKLSVEAKYKHAIVAKDDLKVTGGTYQIKAASKGFDANDSIRIKTGTFDVTAGDDGLHTSNGDEDGKGYVYIEDGTFTISSGDDGIHAETDLIIKDGTIRVTKSEEGLEGYTVTIDGGDIDVIASDDGINAAGGSNDTSGQKDEKLTKDTQGSEDSKDVRGTRKGDEAAGDYQPSEDGQMPEGMQPPTDGEMPEGMQPPTGGQMPDQGGNGKRMMMGADEKAILTINGGTIHVDAGGDGIDCNGYLTINGGEVYVDGPTNAANGALDPGIEMTVNGGTVIAAGSTGFDETFDETSKQYCIRYNFSSVQSGGTKVSLLDSTGKEVLTYTPSKEFSSIVFSCKEIKEGTYKIKTAGTEEEITVSGISTKAGTASSGFGTGQMGPGRSGDGNGRFGKGSRDGGKSQSGTEDKEEATTEE